MLYARFFRFRTKLRLRDARERSVESFFRGWRDRLKMNTATTKTKTAIPQSMKRELASLIGIQCPAKFIGVPV